MSDDLLAITLIVTDIFERLAIPYFIGGSLASNVYGVARATLDSDVVAAIRLDQVESFVAELSPSFYADLPAIKEAVIHHRCFNVIHLATMYKVDVFVAKPDAFTHSQFQRREAHMVSEQAWQTAFLASVEDMILAKLIWFALGDGVSERQWRDILEMLRVGKGRLDEQYLSDWAAEIGVTSLLKRARQEVE